VTRSGGRRPPDRGALGTESSRRGEVDRCRPRSRTPTALRDGCCCHGRRGRGRPDPDTCAARAGGVDGDVGAGQWTDRFRWGGPARPVARRRAPILAFADRVRFYGQLPERILPEAWAEDSAVSTASSIAIRPMTVADRGRVHRWPGPAEVAPSRRDDGVPGHTGSQGVRGAVIAEALARCARDIRYSQETRHRACQLALAP
jgi:hypothetical protein